MPTNMSVDQLMKAIPQWEFSLPKCAKLTTEALTLNIIFFIILNNQLMYSFLKIAYSFKKFIVYCIIILVYVVGYLGDF